MLGLDKPDQGTLQQIGISTAAWAAVFVIINAIILRRRSLGFNNRLVSFLHALFALVICPAALNWQHPLSGFGQTTTDYQVPVMHFVGKRLYRSGTASDPAACAAAFRHEPQLGLLHLRHALLSLH